MSTSVEFEKLVNYIHQSEHGRNNPCFQSRFGTSDVSQESAIQLIKEVERIPQQDSRNDHPSERKFPKAWLKRIGRGNAAKLRRKNAAARRSVGKEVADETQFAPCPQCTPEEQAIYRELSAKLIVAIGRLEALERKVLDQHYQQQKSLNSIGEELGLNRKKVQRLHQRAIEKLKTELGG